VTPFHFHPQVASSLNNLGVVLEAMGRYDEALDALNQCHTLQLQLLAADHPDVAATLNNLGKVLHRTAQHDDALAMLRHALRIRERSFGPSHPKVREPDGKAPLFLISVGSWRQAGSQVAANSSSKAIHRGDEGGIGRAKVGCRSLDGNAPRAGGSALRQLVRSQNFRSGTPAARSRARRPERSSKGVSSMRRLPAGFQSSPEDHERDRLRPLRWCSAGGRDAEHPGGGVG
jgi:hypothetical protein